MANGDAITDEEEFHTSYRVFINALEVLAASPEEQCAMMGNYNVAWELKHDVAAGKYLTNRGYLSPEQESWLHALAGAVGAVPDQVLPAGGELAANLAAMKHASWIPLRTIARQVLDVLRSFTLENAKYLRME